MTTGGEARELLEDVKTQLAEEKRKVARLERELQQAKEQSFLVQKQMEMEEEALTNKMARRLSQLQHEKQQLAYEVEAEEEHISNTLCKRLAMVTAEKVAVEAQLEQESAYVENKLQKRVETLAAEKLALQREKEDLKCQVKELAAAVEQLHQDKCALTNAMDAEEEAAVNRLQRQLEALLSNYRVLEARLESDGVSTRDLLIQPIDGEVDGVYGGRRISCSNRRERSLSASSANSRQSSMNEMRLARTSSSAVTANQQHAPSIGYH